MLWSCGKQNTIEERYAEAKLLRQEGIKGRGEVGGRKERGGEKEGEKEEKAKD